MDPAAAIAEQGVEAFGDINRSQPGFRPAHAEGILLTGSFTLFGDFARHQRLNDNDNAQLTRCLRGAHEIRARRNDVANTCLVETWIDRSERRTWFVAGIVSDL
jgi:hypothetical protein